MASFARHLLTSAKFRRSNGIDLIQSEESNEPAEIDPSSLTGVTEREGSELPMDKSEWTQEELAAYNNLRIKRKKCCIGGCTLRSIPIARSYHQLPARNKETWAKWIEIIRWSRNDPEWGPNWDAASLVCSRHFPDTDFISYEACSRVTVTLTALPIYYVHPPEGTEMDQRFSNPLPLPPYIVHLNLKKESGKDNKRKIDDHEREEVSGAPQLRYEANNLSQFATNYGYDIEEVNDDSSEGVNEDEESVPENLQAHYSNSQRQPINYNYKPANNSSGIRQARLSAPPMLIQQKPKPTANPPRRKLPALIRTNFSPMNSPNPQSKVTPFSGSLKTIVKREHTSNQSTSSAVFNINTQQSQNKNKIGIAKCRLIVNTLEHQLKMATVHLSEQLNIPIPIVHGIWNMKDSLKDKFPSSVELG